MGKVPKRTYICKVNIVHLNAESSPSLIPPSMLGNDLAYLRSSSDLVGVFVRQMTKLIINLLTRVLLLVPGLRSYHDYSTLANALSFPLS